MSTICLRKLHPEVKLPSRGTPGSIGLDIYAHILSEHGRPNTQLLPAHATRVISTGLQIDPSTHHEDPWLVTICSRSGLASKSIFVANAPGIIDPDYRGELKVILFNGGPVSTYINHGDRIAQLIVVRAGYAEVKEVKEIYERTERGAKGLGSTGR